MVPALSVAWLLCGALRAAAWAPHAWLSTTPPWQRSSAERRGGCLARCAKRGSPHNHVGLRHATDRHKIVCRLEACIKPTYNVCGGESRLARPHLLCQGELFGRLCAKVRWPRRLSPLWPKAQPSRTVEPKLATRLQKRAWRVAQPTLASL